MCSYNIFIVVAGLFASFVVTTAIILALLTLTDVVYTHLGQSRFKRYSQFPGAKFVIFLALVALIFADNIVTNRSGISYCLPVNNF